MKIVKKVGMALLAVLVVLLAYAGVKSPDYVISREVTINAPAAKIFPHLNSQKLAEKWGPWLEVDPQVQMVYTGPDAGVGSTASWDSSGQLGKGSATIVESVPNERVLIKLEYSRPMEMKQDSYYLIQSNGGQSVVTWKVEGKQNFVSRFMCMFFDMDKNVGGMFAKGLNTLKATVEKGV